MTERRDQSDAGEIYELTDTALAMPDLPGDVCLRPTVDEVIDMVAADLVVHAENCVREFGDFHVALSGDDVFEPLYRRLMYDPNYRRIPWRRTHLWFVAERCVACGDPRSRSRLIRETIGDHADIPPEQFHPIFAEADDAEQTYAARIRETLSWREKGQDRLDYVLLTVADDGTTAGWTPDLVAANGGLVCRVDDVGGPGWVTMTPDFVNAARFVAVVVTGHAMAPTVRELGTSTAVKGAGSPLPIARIAPMNGELKWYLDEAACLAVD